jgi:hypothetical protein
MNPTKSIIQELMTIKYSYIQFLLFKLQTLASISELIRIYSNKCGYISEKGDLLISDLNKSIPSQLKKSIFTILCSAESDQIGLTSTQNFKCHF